MIGKLRMKFVAVIMTVIAVQLTMIFAGLYVSSRLDFQKSSMKEIRAALHEDYKTTKTASIEPTATKKLETPLLVIDVMPGGKTRILKDNLADINEENVSELIETAAAKKKKSGVLSSLGLRYTRQKHESGITRYVFMDISMEQSSLRSQLVSSLAIGILSFGAFLFAVLKLADWMIKPLQKSWDRQQEFITDASHELKTPLTVILSNVLLLQGASADKSSKEYERLEHIHVESVRMKELVEKLLILTRSDIRVETEQYETTDFSYLVQSVLLRFEPVVFDQRKKLEYKVKESLVVAGDKNNLCQLVEILLDNACKYSEDFGSIRVELSQTANGDILLTVKNSGKPIHKEELKRIFDRFFRLDPSRSHVKGYGLGLSIADSIVSAHGGRIWAESDGLSQNTFFVKLPSGQQAGGKPCNMIMRMTKNQKT